MQWFCFATIRGIGGAFEELELANE